MLVLIIEMQVIDSLASQSQTLIGNGVGNR